MTFLIDARQPEVDFLHSSAVISEEILGEIVSLRVKTLSNTSNFIYLFIYVPVDMRRPKTLLLTLPTIWSY